MKGIGEAKAEIEARAAERFAGEQADYEAKMKAREDVRGEWSLVTMTWNIRGWQC